MIPNDIDTRSLWKFFLFLVNSLVVVVICVLAYFILEDHITEFLNKPNYSLEELEEMSKRRERMMRQERADNWNLIENGIHIKTGLVADENLQLIIGACTSCHSAKLITQNRATRTGWKNMIVWMQKTQGLPDLGSSESNILDYLSKHYAPEETGRRRNLDMEAIEWYVLDLVKDD